MSALGKHNWPELTEYCKQTLTRKYGAGYIGNSKSGNIPEKAIMETFSLCLFKRSGLMDANGKVVRSEIRYTIGQVVKNKAELRRYVKQCAVNRKTPGETGTYLYKCLAEDVPQDLYKKIEGTI